MAPWGLALADAGFTVTCPLLPGHGRTWPEMNRTTWPDWYREVDSLYALAERCGTGVRVRTCRWAARSRCGWATARPGGRRPGAGEPVGDNGAQGRGVSLPLAGQARAVDARDFNDIKKPGATELAYRRLPLRAAASLSKLWQVVRGDLDRIDHRCCCCVSAEDACGGAR